MPFAPLAYSTSCQTDGCGGGGGSGHVDYSAVHVDDSANGFQSSYLHPPTITKIEYDAMEISWDDNQQSFNSKHDIRFFHIELSQGREGSGFEGGACSDDYEVVDYIQAGSELELNARIGRLLPATTYCVRLVVVGDRGVSRKSKAAKATTQPPPRNKWWHTYPRDNYEFSQNIAIGHEPICDIPNHPTPRRGHSMSFVNGKVYLFGGLTETCICKNESADSCEDEMIYSNEVWILDTFTSIWKQLKAHSWSSTVPAGREQHSATVLPNGKIVMIGGRTDSSETYSLSNQPLLLGDVWEMDPGQVTSHVISASTSKQSLPTELKDGHVSFHSLQVDLFSDNDTRDNEFCIKDLSVQVLLYHPCVEQLGFIALYGPGSTPSSKQPSQFTGNDAKVREHDTRRLYNIHINTRHLITCSTIQTSSSFFLDQAMKVAVALSI